MTRLTSRDTAAFHASLAVGTGPADDEMENKMLRWHEASKAEQAPTGGAELTTADLDAVSGGINPQPLPPMVHERS